MKINYLLFNILFTSLVLMSCNGNKEQGEKVDNNKQNTDTTSYAATDDLQAADTTIRLPEILPRDLSPLEIADTLIGVMSPQYDTSAGIPHFLNRFNATNKIMFTLHPKNAQTVDSGIAVNIYQYPDSTSMHNAMFNWFHCFGEQCIQIEAGKHISAKGLKTSLKEKTIAIFDPVTFRICLIRSTCTGNDEPIRYLKTMLLSTKSASAFQLELSCSKGLTWYGEIPEN